MIDCALTTEARVLRQNFYVIFIAPVFIHIFYRMMDSNFGYFFVERSKILVFTLLFI